MAAYDKQWHGVFLSHNNIVCGLRYAPLLRVVHQQAAYRDFEKAKVSGVWYDKIRKAPAVLKA